MAFLACSLSNIKPIRTFGIFAALIVPIDFALTILMQPITYYIYEVYIEQKWNTWFKKDVIYID